jgi:hypothetical protein
MATNFEELQQLSSSELASALSRLVVRERASTAELIAALAEFDARRLYLPEGFPSLFAYCTERLHFSEHEAYHRIEAARAARLFPAILPLLADGALTLTAVALLRPHLTDENHVEVLGSAKHLSKRAVEELVARLHPRPDLRPFVRKLPERPAPDANSRSEVVGTGGGGGALLDPIRCPGPAEAGSGGAGGEVGGCGEVGQRAESDGEVESHGAEECAPGPTSAACGRPAIVQSLAPSRYRVQMTISAETHERLRRAQDLLRHVVPSGDIAIVFDRALTLLVEDLERKKFAARMDDARSEGAPRLKRRAQASGRRTTRAKREPEEVVIETPRPEEAPPYGGGASPSALQAATVESMPVAREVPGQTRRSRHIPASVRRGVWRRDGGQCAFVGAAGRCPERGFLEFHHETPFAAGGESTVANTSLRCRRHNGWEAELFFGAMNGTPDRGQLGPDRVGINGGVTRAG